MYQKVVYIHPISKLEPRVLKKKKKSSGDQNLRGKLDFGAIFWDKLFFSDEFIHRDKIFKNTSFLSGGSIDSAVQIFRDTDKKLASAKEMVFIFDIFSRFANEFNATHKDWKISLSNSLSHISSDFDANNINLSKIESVVEDGGGVVGNMIRDIVDEYDIRDSIVVFDFFWPTDLLQLFLISKKLKEHNNIIIIDATKANEQADYSQWIKIFTDNPWLSSLFDYCIVYQDYGQALQKLVAHIKIGNHNISLDESFQNIVYFNQGKTYFKKPGEIAPDNLFKVFTNYYHQPSKIYQINNVKTIGMRLFSYKCYWSSCFFCTINSTHLYKYNKENIDYIKASVDFIEKNNIGYVYFSDEAIHVDDIVAFARMLLERNISVIYRFRTRFDEGYTQEVCNILAKSGAVFCGIGLECASDRVSALVNKGNEMNLSEKIKIITHFEKAGISFHNYAIFGLPGETPEESYETYYFLKRNIESRNNYNCTPNIFGLNRGSMYHRHPEKFGIQLLENTDNDTLLNLRLDYIKNTKAQFLQKKYAKDIHILQFLSFYNPLRIDSLNPVLFWEFIDRTGLYYHAKAFSKKQPFLSVTRKIPIENLGAYEFSQNIEWRDGIDERHLINLENGFSVSFPMGLDGMNVIRVWDTEKTLTDNLRNPIFEGIQSEIIYSIVHLLIQSEILIHSDRGIGRDK